MPVDLATLNLALDAAIKLVFLGVFVYLIFILRNLDRTIRSVERSAESIEKTSKTIGKLFVLERYLPFVGRDRRD